MPRLWTDTLDEHRHAVHEAIVDTTVRLVRHEGLRSVTMSRIAEEAGIGRATLYKYFGNVESILLAWHRDHVARHLDKLIEVRDRQGSPMERLTAVLETYALLSRESRQRHDVELAAILHRDHAVAHAEHKVRALVRDLISAGVDEREVRSDVPCDELAGFCLHALDAAGSLQSKAAVGRLVTVTVAGLRPPDRTDDQA